MLKKSLVTCFFGACAILPIAPVAANPSCFELGLTGGWFKVGNTARTYGVTRSDASTTASIGPNGTVLDINPKWQFGGGGYLNYTPCGQPYAWGISYFTDRSKKVISNTGPVGITVGVPDVSSVIATGVATAYKTQYQYATITLATTHAACCDVVHIKPHLGIGYLNQREHHGILYSGINNVAGTSLVVANDSRFSGWGPVIGTDLKYCFCGDFSLFGNFEYAALLGKIRGKAVTYSNNIGRTARTVSFGSDNSNSFVSQILSEIGVGYCFNFWCFDRGNIALGWRFTKMFDVNRRLDFVNDTNPNRLVNSVRNANLQGPFLRLALGF